MNPDAFHAPNLQMKDRKRLLVMNHIQRVALDLFDAHGYAAVTVEHVAHAADVSPSTVYRHFGSKDRLVLHDDNDLTLIGLFIAQPSDAPLIETARAAVEHLPELLDHDMDILRRRIRLMVGEPTVYAALCLEIRASVDGFAAGLATRYGLPDNDVKARMAANTLVWAVMTAAEQWYANDFDGELQSLLRRSLDVVADGLRLDVA